MKAVTEEGDWRLERERLESEIGRLCIGANLARVSPITISCLEFVQQIESAIREEVVGRLGHLYQ